MTTEITQNNLQVKSTSSNNFPSIEENEKKRKLNEDDQMVIELESNMRKQAKLQK